MQTIAIVGAGPAGLVAARYLSKEGFDPVMFEQGDRIGGQWTGDVRSSGGWVSMRTSRVMTSFSDLRGSHTRPFNPPIRLCMPTCSVTQSICFLSLHSISLTLCFPIYRPSPNFVFSAWRKNPLNGQEAVADEQCGGNRRSSRLQNTGWTRGACQISCSVEAFRSALNPRVYLCLSARCPIPSTSPLKSGVVLKTATTKV
jgi:hypothetical protein